MILTECCGGTKSSKDAAWNKFTQQFVGRSLTTQEMSEHVYGRTNSQTMEFLAGCPLTSKKITQLTQHKEEIYRALCLDQGQYFCLSPGAEELLDKLVEKHIPHTIATSSEITNLTFFFEHLQLARWFDIQTVVFDDGQRAAKPEPDIYLEAARRLNIEPTQAVVVEDSTSGLEAARRAGIGKIVALGPKARHSQLASIRGVDQVVESVREIDLRWFNLH